MSRAMNRDCCTAWLRDTRPPQGRNFVRRARCWMAVLLYKAVIPDVAVAHPDMRF